ncbi:MAG: L28 family ribosomal protein [Patescibacteria group bacterium]
MSRICDHCGRGPKKTTSRSHSHVATKYWQYPNLQPKKVAGKRLLLCVKCIKNLVKA